MKILTILIAISALLLIVGCTVQQPVKQTETVAVEEEQTAASAKNSEASIYTVVIENEKFMPANLEIKAGDTVEWVNKDNVDEEDVDEEDVDENDADHTVTFENIEFNENLPVGATASYTFEEAGEFSYRCSFHPSMQGRVMVK